MMSVKSFGHAALALATTTFITLIVFSSLVAADCECGYAANIDGNDYLFTELMESDFAHLPNISSNKDWIRQQFNKTSKERGSLSQVYSIDNIYTDPNLDDKGEIGLGSDGKPAGLDMVVRSNRINGMVPVAELDSNRSDIIYGTFRVAMRLTNVPGTCSAFFWYYNDTEEIDMEFLSKDFHAYNRSYPVNLVLQSREAAAEGYNDPDLGNYVVAYLPFDPIADFHEYRFDFLPTSVLFYADNQLLARMDSTAVPTHAGHLVLAHWSNGNVLWTGGPPRQNAVTTIAYAKSYFNSTAQQRHSDWAKRCPNVRAPKAVCHIPETTPADNSSAGFFFTYHRNMTNNQTVSPDQKKSLGQRMSPALTWPLLVAALFGGGWSLGMW